MKVAHHTIQLCLVFETYALFSLNFLAPACVWFITEGARLCENGTFLGLASTIFTQSINSDLGGDTTKYTSVHGVCIGFWPTAHITH